MNSQWEAPALGTGRLVVLILIGMIVVSLGVGAEPRPKPSPGTDFSFRGRVAAADMRLASEWMSAAYEVPARVGQEMLIAGYSYADTVVALALMAKGASLNELLDLRSRLRWDEVADQVELDANALPKPIRELLWFGRNDPPPPVLQYLPDVYTGLSRDLTLAAFSPTFPGIAVSERFRLSDDEIANIRRVLADPLGVPDEDLLLPAGRGLTTADWVLAGSIAHHKPFAADSILAARVGEELSWAEICMAFGIRSEVLTQGPLAGIYPVLSGSAPHTILCARRRRNFPDRMALMYDLARITPGESRALYPLMTACYRASASEQQSLHDTGYEMGEQAIALGLARLAKLELSIILQHHQQGESWGDIIRRFAIDMSGQDALLAAIAVREGG